MTLFKTLLLPVLLLGLAHGAHGQGLPKPPGELRFAGFTAPEVEAMTPSSSNPYVSFLPAGVEPDYVYWNARLALEAHRRTERRAGAASLARTLVYSELEPATTLGQNDSPASAELVAGFGTGAGADAVLQIQGSLLVVPPPSTSTIAAFPENDGALPLASVAGIGVNEAVRIQGATIGDGPFGSTSGDYDWYAVTATAAGQLLRADVDATGDLDSFLGLYDADGLLLAYNDDDESGVSSLIEYRASAPGTYYFAVFGFGEGFQEDPFDAASGPGAGSTGGYDLTLSLVEADFDAFSFALEAGDVVGVGDIEGAVTFSGLYGPDGALMMGSSQDLSAIYPVDSPLPSGGGAGVTAAVVVPSAGTYVVAVGGAGTYTLGVRAFRPRLEDTPGGRQTLFVDFDGATLDAEQLFGFGNASATLSPLAAFLDRWGLGPQDENAVIDAVLAVLEENLRDDLRSGSNNPTTDVVLLNSRDHADPGTTPLVSRLVIGGTIEELGIETIGIATSIDPGNYGLEDVGVVLLDILSEPSTDPNSLNQYELGAGASVVDLVGVGVGNIAAHEAGHFLGLYHTDQFNETVSIIDQGGNLAGSLGIGSDGVFGTADDVDVDFVLDVFVGNEGLTGTQDQANTVAFALSTGGGTTDSDGPTPTSATVSSLYPNPLRAGTDARIELVTERDEAVRLVVYDVLGRPVLTAFDGRLSPGRTELITIPSSALASGVYLVRVEGEKGGAVRRLTVLR